MRNYILGLLSGLTFGVWIATAVLSPAQSGQPGNPYAPGSFNNETLLYQGMISADTDAYLNSKPFYAPPAPSLFGRTPCP